MIHKKCVKSLCKDKLKCPECNEPVNYEQVVELKDILKFNGKSFKSRDIINYVRKNFSYYDAEQYLIPLIQHISKQDGIIQQLKNSLDLAEKGCFYQLIFNILFKIKLSVFLLIIKDTKHNFYHYNDSSQLKKNFVCFYPFPKN